MSLISKSWKVAASTVVVLLATGCTSAPQEANNSADGSTPREGGDITSFLSSDPATLDPAMISGYDQTLVAINVLEGLFRVSADGTRVDAALAESATPSEDGLTWAITIRPSTFQDGSPVTADDVKFSFERLVDPDTISPRGSMLDVVAGAVEFRGGNADGIAGIRAISENEIEIELVAPYAPFTALLASPNLAIVPRAAVEADPENFGKNVISAGPFRVSDWKVNQSVTATAFDDYWNGRPYLDSVTWQVIPDENTRIVEFEANALDVTWLPPASYTRYMSDDAWTPNILRANTLHTEMLAVNMDRPLLGGSLDLRKAICMGVDRAAAIASLQDRATAAFALLPESLEGDNTTEACAADPDAAAEVIADSGIAGKTVEMISPNWPNLVKTLELYQANLKELGLGVELIPLEFAQYQARVDEGDFDLAWTYRVPDFIDADSFLTPLLASDRIGFGNAARYTNSDVDEWLAQARSSMDDAERSSLYGEINAQVMSELAYIPLLHNVWVDIHQPRVRDYTPSAMDMHDFSKVWLSE